MQSRPPLNHSPSAQGELSRKGRMRGTLQHSEEAGCPLKNQDRHEGRLETMVFYGLLLEPVPFFNRLLKFADCLAACNGRDTSVQVEVDVFTDEFHGSIAQSKLPATNMLTLE